MLDFATTLSVASDLLAMNCEFGAIFLTDGKVQLDGKGKYVVQSCLTGSYNVKYVGEDKICN